MLKSNHRSGQFFCWACVVTALTVVATLLRVVNASAAETNATSSAEQRVRETITYLASDELEGRGVDTLIFCGLTTECCVQSSAWDAFERDFHVFIAQDAVAAYEPGLHQAALRSLELSGAILAPASAFAAAWK